MYKRVGLDPTKTRPSSEALLRRVRKGDSLPRINSMVDVCNWCSLEFQLPYGLYDAAQHRRRRRAADRARRASRIRASARTTCTSAAGSRWPTRVGPFGNPTSDSARTMVTTATTRALLVVFAPRDVDERRLSQVLDVTVAPMREFTGCANGSASPSHVTSEQRILHSTISHENSARARPAGRSAFCCVMALATADCGGRTVRTTPDPRQPQTSRMLWQ